MNSVVAKVPVESDKVRQLRVLVTVAKQNLTRNSQPLVFSVSDATHHETHQTNAVFISGGQP